jgi:hypothetical protein
LAAAPRGTSFRWSSVRKSAWATLLIFVVIAHFNPEALTGSTSLARYLTPTNLSGILFYGLQVAVLADLYLRYQLKWTTLYILGLLYGVLEEGVAVQTMLSPAPPGFVGVYRILGVNATWAVFIATFHALVSVVSTIIIVRLIWPDRVSKPFMRRGHYAVVLPSLAAIYALFILFVTASYAPALQSFVVLGVACLALVVIARWNQRRPVARRLGPGPRSYFVWGALLLVVGELLPLVLGSTASFALPATLLVIGVGIGFASYFRSLDSEEVPGGSRLFCVFASLVGFWLVLGAFFRDPPSNFLAFGGAALCFGWRAARGRTGTPPAPV